MRQIFFAFAITLSNSLLVMGQDDLPGVGDIRMDVFADMTLTKKVYSGLEPVIDFHWSYHIPVAGVPEEGFSVRLRGFISAPRDGQYKILFAHNDGVRFELNGIRVLDEWKYTNKPAQVSVELTRKPQPFAVEFHELREYAFLTMYWQAPGAPFPQIVPQTAFTRGGNSQPTKLSNGLKALYFDHKFSRQIGKGTVFRAESLWSDFAPAGSTAVDGGARYSGYIVPPESGTYKFVTWGDDKIRIWLDDEPLTEYQLKKKNRLDFGEGFRKLTKDEPVSLRIETLDIRGPASWFLHWVPPGETTPVSIPPQLLFQTSRAAKKK